MAGRCDKATLLYQSLGRELSSQLFPPSSRRAHPTPLCCIRTPLSGGGQDRATGFRNGPGVGPATRRVATATGRAERYLGGGDARGGQKCCILGGFRGGRPGGWGRGGCCLTSVAWWVQCGDFEPPYVYSRCHSGAGDTIEWYWWCLCDISFENPRKGGDPESENRSARFRDLVFTN